MVICKADIIYQNSLHIQVLQTTFIYTDAHTIQTTECCDRKYFARIDRMVMNWNSKNRSGCNRLILTIGVYE